MQIYEYPEDQSPPPRRSLWPILSVVIAVLAVALVAVVVLVGSHRTITGIATRPTDEAWTTEPSVTSTSQASASPTSSAPRTPITVPAGPRLPDVTPPHDGTTGPFGGPTYGPKDLLYHFNPPSLPFEFDLPASWGCVARENPAPMDVKMTCADNDNPSHGPGGWIGLFNCAAPCGDAEQQAARARLPIDEKDWKSVDSTTWYSHTKGTLKSGELAVRAAMVHAFPSTKDGKPETIAAVMLTGPPDSNDLFQKIVNEIRMRIPY